MNRMIEIFQQILQKYRFISPVTPAQQKAVIGLRRKGLSKLLKVIEEYNIIYMQAVNINIIARKIGIRISMLQSKITVGLLFIILTAAASYGMIQLVKTINNKAIEEPAAGLKRSAGEIPRRIDTPGGRVTAVPGKTAEPENKYLAGISAFDGADRQRAGIVTDGILNALKEIKGDEKILDVRTRKSGSARLMIMGSVKEIGGNYIIIADLIDMEKSSIIFSSSMKLGREDDITSVCRGIARGMAERIK